MRALRFGVRVIYIVNTQTGMTDVTTSEGELTPPPPPEATQEVYEEPAPMAFSILRQGAIEPGGPYSEQQILLMLQEKKISKKDYVFYQGMRDWRPLEEVFEIHEKFNHMLEDGQDRFKVAEAYSEVSNVLMNNEDIYYVAIDPGPGWHSHQDQAVRHHLGFPSLSPHRKARWLRVGSPSLGGHLQYPDEGRQE